MASTVVCNIKHLGSSWKDDNKYVYIGRAGKGMSGYYGNPIEVGKRCVVCGRIHTKGGATLPCYFKWLSNKLQNDDIYLQAVKSLRGKTLVCFCKPSPCHGDILAQFAEKL